jgi:bisphosphoglycerate-independent phosphoglycerate mutase (AlkP superfamily)
LNRILVRNAPAARPPNIDRTSGEYLAKNGLKTFACSETQKFGHVTFFWNGNRSGYFNEVGRCWSTHG